MGRSGHRRRESPIRKHSCDIALEIARILGKPRTAGDFVKIVTWDVPLSCRANSRREIRAVSSMLIARNFRDKNVLLVDDSIVRGTTSGADHRDGGSRREEGLSGVRRAGNSFPNVIW